MRGVQLLDLTNRRVTRLIFHLFKLKLVQCQGAVVFHDCIDDALALFRHLRLLKLILRRVVLEKHIYTFQARRRSRYVNGQIVIMA